MKGDKIGSQRRPYFRVNMGSEFCLKKDFPPLCSRRRWWWNHLSSVCPRMEKFVVSVEIDACFHLQLCEYASKFRRLLPPHQSRGITAKPTLIQNIWIGSKICFTRSLHQCGASRALGETCFHLQFCEYASKFRQLLPPHQSCGITAKSTLIYVV